MKCYVLNWAGSGATSEINADDDDDAIRQARLILGGSPVVADQWDANGWNEDDQPCKRILFWADEADAENDAGVNAVAQLSTIGDA